MHFQAKNPYLARIYYYAAFSGEMGRFFVFCVRVWGK
jgi:hypothetical protein